MTIFDLVASKFVTVANIRIENVLNQILTRWRWQVSLRQVRQSFRFIWKLKRFIVTHLISLLIGFVVNLSLFSVWIWNRKLSLWMLLARMKRLSRIITNVFVKSNYDMCTVDFFAQLFLLMTIAQGKPRKMEKNVMKNLELKIKEIIFLWHSKSLTCNHIQLHWFY